MTSPLSFPPDVYVVGEASTTLTAVGDIAVGGPDTTDTGAFVNQDAQWQRHCPAQFQLIPYNNLVYMVRAVANVAGAGRRRRARTVSGLLIDTFVPQPTGNSGLAQGARHKRSGMQFFGATYTPTTMVDTLDNLDFTSITGETFYVPTIFIPIPELDATHGLRRRPLELPRPAVLDLHLSGDRRAAGRRR